MAKAKEETTQWVSPSRLSAWGLCPFRAENEMYKESEATKLGTAFHSVVEDILLGKQEPAVMEYQIAAWIDSWKRIPAVKRLLSGQEIILLVDGQDHPLARPLYGKTFIHLPLNATKKNGLRGYPDLVSTDGESLTIWDWKTGRNEPDEEQIKAYCWMALELWPDYSSVVGRYVMVASGQIFEYAYSKQDFEGYATSIVRIANKIQKAEKSTLDRKLNKYCKWCQFCADCSETKAISVELPWALAQAPQTPEQADNLWNTIKKLEAGKGVLESLIEQGKESMKSACKSAEFCTLKGISNDYIVKTVPSSSYSYPMEKVLDLVAEKNLPTDFLSLSVSALEKAIADRPDSKEIIGTIKNWRSSNGTREILDKCYKEKEQ